MSTYLGERVERELIYVGAEAEIYLEDWHGELAIRKTRTTKPYRIPELDDVIRRGRTSHEASMMHEVRKLGVRVPIIRHIELDSTTLIMEFIRGPTLKDELFKLAMPIKRSRCFTLGESLAKMHEGGAVHGDMTVSNVLSDNGQLFVIDFGLGGLSDEIEDRGVDLLLLQRSLKSTHYGYHRQLFKSFLDGYSQVSGRDRADEVMRKMREIERRGRYFERR